jgi:hypothetical protein
MKKRIALSLAFLDDPIIMEIQVPDDRDTEEYIDELLERILAEDFRYSAEWDFV